MRRFSLVGMVRNVVSMPLVALLAACGDVSPQGEELEDSLPQPVIDDTAALDDAAALEAASTHARKPAPPRNGYEVVIIDPAQYTHEPNAINDRGQIVG